MPGAEYLYCNSGYVLASIIVQRASGQSFEAYCQENIFRPHGMTHSRWRTDFRSIVPVRATGYSPAPEGGYLIDTPYSDIIGNGGLLFTAGDLLKWNASLDETSGEWGAVAQALQTPSRLSNGHAIEYGLGLAIDEYAGLKEIAHGGSTSGYRTYLARFPERRLSFALLGNAGDFNPAPVADALTRLILDLPTPSPPQRVPVTAEVVARYAGLYHSSQTDDVISLTVESDKLFHASAELIPTAPGTFENRVQEKTYVFTGTPVRSLTVAAPNGTVTYSPVEHVTPSTSQLAAYAGIYRSEELDVTDFLSVKEGRLWFECWPGSPVEAKPTFADGFHFGPLWHATFTRDASGAITGYEMTNGRCRRIRFARH